MLNQEESRLKKQGGHSINLVGQGAGKELKVKAKNFKKNKAPAKVSQDAYKELNVDVCRFCKKEGHYLKDFLKRKAYFEKKGTFSAFVCFESNLVEVSIILGGFILLQLLMYLLRCRDSLRSKLRIQIKKDSCSWEIA